MEQLNSPTDMERYLRYVGLNEDDERALHELAPVVEANADEFIERFYTHLKACKETRAFLVDDAVVRRLLSVMRRYLVSLFEGRFDEAYFENRRMIGRTHFQIGLGFRWYIGAYTQFLHFLIPLARTHYTLTHGAVAAGRIKADEAESAVRKVILLDMSIVLDAFHEGDIAALEAAREQVAHQEKLAAVGLLSSGLAHEIGNPLASIQAVCDNQLRKNLDPQIADKFHRIRGQVERISTIVRQLVNFARPATSSVQAVEVNDVIESALAIAKLSRSAKALVAVKDLAPDLPPAHCAADQLAQVFLNLFLNSIDAMHDAGGELIVRSSLTAERDWIAISIEDNGCGIAPEHLEKIFTPFFTTKEVGKGTGLGLHVSEGIVKRYGGRIRVRSVAGQGSVFTVELPVEKTAVKTENG